MSKNTVNCYRNLYIIKSWQLSCLHFQVFSLRNQVPDPNLNQKSQLCVTLLHKNYPDERKDEHIYTHLHYHTLKDKEIKWMWNKAWFHSLNKICGIKGLFCSYCNQSQILRLNDIPHRLIIFKINGNKGITIVALTRNTGFNFQQHQILQVFERLGETKLKINSSISAV